MLKVGPVIQRDLVDITIRFRQHPFVITDDIEKMYRQVKIADYQRSLQVILWRENNNEPVKEYDLNTLTFGTTSTSFLATRCLYQLALNNKDKYLEACEVIQRDFYVDDLLTGASTIEQAIKIKRKINLILHSGCFNLRKWNSNSAEILQERKPAVEARELGEQTKILGLVWLASSDQLLYNVGPSINSKETSKREIFSVIS